MSARSAAARLERLLSMVPWIAERDGPTIDQICTTFDLSRADLLADLDVVFLVGLHPFTPDELVEVAVSDDRVWIRYAEYFGRPLRLSPEQGLALVTAGAGLRSLDGVVDGGPLDRGLAKLAEALGVTPAKAIEIELDGVDRAQLAELREAVSERRTVSIDYYSYGRDERSVREVDPTDVRFSDGHWYLLAWCHRSQDDRVFRVDRIHDTVRTESTFEPRESPDAVGVDAPGASHPQAVLDLPAGARWVVDTYPCRRVSELSHGRLRAELPVSGRAWLERLLLSLGPDTRVLDDQHGDVAAEAAARLLVRYRGVAGE